MLTEPLQMANPREAFTENPWVDAHVDLTHRGVSPMYGGEPVNDDGTPLLEGSLRWVRARPLRAAHGGEGHDPRRRRASGRSTGSVCAITRGDRASGRRRGGTGGSPRTSAATSASSCRSSRRATAAGATAAWCCATASTSTSPTRRSRPAGTGDDQYHARGARDRDDERRHLRDHRPGAEPHPVAQPPRRRPRANSSSRASPKA